MRFNTELIYTYKKAFSNSTEKAFLFIIEFLHNRYPVIINGSVNGTSYTANQIADLTGMTKDQARQFYLFYTSKHGDTSGLILVLVTAAVGGLFEDATVSAIVRTISIGSFCAIMLILFILPGVLAACDKLVIKKKNRFENVK